MKTVIIPERKAVMQIPDKVKPALCLDLDDTVRYSKNGKFINGPDDIILFNDVEDKIWEYRDKGFLVFGISNQGGVAYGYKTSIDVNIEIEATCNLFQRNPFHIIKSCLHHPKGTREPYNYRSLLRKPDIGMLALCEFEAWGEGYIIDWDNSLFVGDRHEDQQCAENAGIKFVWHFDFFSRPQEAEKYKGRICTYCNRFIGMDNLAGITVQVGDNLFCDAICAEGWIDK